MYHAAVSFTAHWIAPIMTGAFVAVLPILISKTPTGKH